MSLQRYINNQTILTLNGARYGQLWTEQDLKVFTDDVLIPTDPSIVAEQISELHIYSFYGDYILGNHAASYTVYDSATNSLLINVAKTFKEANIEKGSYVIVNNLFKKVWGGFGSEPCLVREISPDRTEIKFVVDSNYKQEYSAFIDEINSFKEQNILNNIVVNFGYNRIQKLLNVRFESDVFYVKLYQPIFDDIIELDKCYFAFEIMDPYVDSVILTSPIQTGITTVIPGPNYYLDTSLYTGESTSFKSWDDMLDSNLPTTQRLIEETLSGSNQVRLNIDYSDLNNFVFYSSAAERIQNFKYKISKVEEYSASIATLSETTASNTIFVSNSINLNNRRIDQITSNFDPFERWLYYSPTGSVFSYDLSGSITPFPKRANNTVYGVSASISQAWFTSTLAEAEDYDRINTNRLYWAIPEHIIMDEANSDFILFVDMIGQHYDTSYAYIKALTQIHERDEHPQRGFSNDLSYYIAKSFGWNLQNTKGLSELWKYKLGNSSSSLHPTTDEEHSQQVWRRIVNNLPYLLKTKGTERSIKAMMSIYGIPQTLISIKEFGGPSTETNKPQLIEDRYYYKTNFTGSNWIELPRQAVNPTSGSWGGITRVPDTVEFRFSTNYSASLSMSLWAIESPTRNNVYANLELCHVKSLTGNYLYSGSNSYGYLKFTVAENNGGTIISSSVQSELLPLFNNDSWNVAITSEDATDDNLFFDSDATALSSIGSGSEYFTSNDNVFGWPMGIVRSTPTTTVYSDDNEAINYILPGTTYFVSASNPYGLTPNTSKYLTLSASLTLYDNDSDAISSGVPAGSRYGLSISNSYSLTEGVEKLLLGSNVLKIRIGSTGDCANGRMAFTSSMQWTGSYSLGTTWGNDLSGSTSNYILIGGTTGSQSNRFVGTIHGYKEYFETITQQTFNSHVLNPAAYNGNNSTSSYYTLYRYFPLGLDTQKWDHSVYVNVSSSQPNRVVSFQTTASFKAWNFNELEQYIPAREKFYIYLPSLGGNVIRSQKVRIEGSKLIRDLSPTVKSDISENDTNTFDTNRLAIVFSPTDQVNNDIFNHTGFDELDDFIADPQYEFDEDYTELERFNHQYFQKYRNRVDVNAYIKLFSIYDFSFFEQIKQLIPGRADYIGGVLIEDDVLHRNKTLLTKRPVVTNPQYLSEYDLNIHSSSAWNLTYNSTITASVDFGVKFDYLSASIDTNVEVEYKYHYYTGSFNNETTVVFDSLSHPESGSFDTELPYIQYPYSGSQTVSQSYIDSYPKKCCYKKVIYHYSASSNYPNEYQRQWAAAVSKSYGWHYSRSLECTDYQYLESCASENAKRFGGSTLVGLGININSNETVDGGPVISVFVSNAQTVYYKDDDPNNGNLKVE